MTNNNPDYLHLASRKFSITCATCGVTETFYSELSVGYFRLKHAGHELVEASAKETPLKESLPPVGFQPDVQAETPAEAWVEPIVEAEAPIVEERPRRFVDQQSPEIRIDRVLVDTMVSPVDNLPIIRVRGTNQDGRTFVRLFRPEEAGKMRQFLGSGRFEDLDAENLVYTWDSDVISFEQEQVERPVPEETKDEQPVPESEPAPRPPVDSVLASMEALAPEVAPMPIPEPPRAPQPSSPRRKKVKKVKVHAIEVDAKAAPAVVETQVPPEPKKNRETLLLAKSSYIQEGEESMNEAKRISKILKAFRWNVEPVYTIGVIVDDNLSIETNKGEVSGALMKQIEGAGYKLSAVTVNSSKPTAWFKRRADPELPGVDDPERTRHLEEKVAELTKALQDERAGASEQKAAWEKRFDMLTDVVKSMRGRTSETASGFDSSEPRPETDVTS